MVDIENNDGISILSSVGRKSISKCFAAVLYAEGVKVLAGHTVVLVQHCHWYCIFRPKISKSTHVTGSLSR